MQSWPGRSFDRTSRLVKAEDFRQVFANNIRIGDDCLTLLIGRFSTDRPRIGFAIAKKQVKRAVHRNRLKRLIRESFRHRAPGLPKRHIVVMVRGNVIKLTNKQIFDRLDEHWRSLNSKCANS